ncbi:hypothetical protein MRX96_016113 [Rhipicephalus microplus]
MKLPLKAREHWKAAIPMLQEGIEGPDKRKGYSLQLLGASGTLLSRGLLPRGGPGPSLSFSVGGATGAPPHSPIRSYGRSRSVPRPTLLLGAAAVLVRVLPFVLLPDEPASPHGRRDASTKCNRASCRAAPVLSSSGKHDCRLWTASLDYLESLRTTARRRDNSMKIDYPDCELLQPGQRQSCTTMNLERLLALEPDEVAVETRHTHHHIQLPLDCQQTSLQKEGLLKSNRSSRSSDTSSAYSGSDTMQSVQSSLEDNEVDLSGLVESTVDSDEEEDLAESIDSLTVRDAYHECLERDPNDRTEDDIETLLEFMQPLPAFANMTLSVRRELCAVMVFAVVEKAGTVVMNHGEELDSWSVIVNGQVEVEMPDGTTHTLQMGDSFGITPTMDKMNHQRRAHRYQGDARSTVGTVV